MATYEGVVTERLRGLEPLKPLPPLTQSALPVYAPKEPWLVIDPGKWLKDAGFDVEGWAIDKTKEGMLALVRSEAFRSILLLLIALALLYLAVRPATITAVTNVVKEL